MIAEQALAACASPLQQALLPRRRQRRRRCVSCGGLQTMHTTRQVSDTRGGIWGAQASGGAAAIPRAALRLVEHVRCHLPLPFPSLRVLSLPPTTLLLSPMMITTTSIYPNPLTGDQVSTTTVSDGLLLPFLFLVALALSSPSSPPSSPAPPPPSPRHPHTPPRLYVQPTTTTTTLMSGAAAYVLAAAALLLVWENKRAPSGVCTGCGAFCPAAPLCPVGAAADKRVGHGAPTPMSLDSATTPPFPGPAILLSSAPSVSPHLFLVSNLPAGPADY